MAFAFETGFVLPKYDTSELRRTGQDSIDLLIRWRTIEPDFCCSVKII